jgi:hypothetical protein
MAQKSRKMNPGQKVVLKELPPGLVDGLLRSDQEAISEVVGKPILLVTCEDDGRAELEFVDKKGHIHFIWVDPKFIRPV